MPATRRRSQLLVIEVLVDDATRSGLSMAIPGESQSRTGISSTASPRFALRRRDFSHAGNNYLDGGWWPRSTDLATEVDQLVTDAAAKGFEIARLLYRLDEWAMPPRRVQVGGTQLKLSGYREQPKDTVTLIDDTGQLRVDLVVVPADSDNAVAARAMQIAATDHDPDPSEAVLSRARNG